jgi:hypothetical protein
MFFVQDYRERIKEENPNATFGEVGKLLGAKWKEMSDAEKKVRRSPCWWSGRLLTSQPYEKQATQDKVRAADAKAAYDGGKPAPAAAKKATKTAAVV